MSDRSFPKRKDLAVDASKGIMRGHGVLPCPFFGKVIITVILDKQKMRFYNISKVKGVDEDSNLPMERSREPGRVGAGTSTGKEKITSEPLR